MVRAAGPAGYGKLLRSGAEQARQAQSQAFAFALPGSSHSFLGRRGTG